MTRAAKVIPAADIVKTLQVAQDREAARARSAERHPPYEWDLVLLVGRWMSTFLLIMVLVLLISLYQSRG